MLDSKTIPFLDLLSSPTERKTTMPVGTQDANSNPWYPYNTSFPSRKDLLRLPDAPEDAAWVWGKVS